MPTYTVDAPHCCCGSGGPVSTGTPVDECPDNSDCTSCGTWDVAIDSSEFGDCQDCYDAVIGTQSLTYDGSCFWWSYDEGLGEFGENENCCDAWFNDWSITLECVCLNGNGMSCVGVGTFWQEDQTGFSEAAGQALPDGLYWRLWIHSSGGFADADHADCGTAGFVNWYSYQLIEEEDICPKTGSWPIHNQDTNSDCDGITEATLS